MSLRRREFLNRIALGAGVAAAAGCRAGESSNLAGTEAAVGTTGTSEPSDKWGELRQQFDLSPDYVHMSALLIVSHPAPVREAIETYRREIDRNPVLTLQEHNRDRQRAAREAAGRYLGVDADDIALTDSTTMGVGLVYNGLRLREGDEIVTTEQDY
jgi:isopenicillin-N epimerase